MPRRSKVTIEGLEGLERKLDELSAAVARGERRAVRDEVDELADDMRRGAPRDTGALIESIQGEVSASGLSGTVAATARHAPFVEHGTSDTAAQPYAMPAAERARVRFVARVKREIIAELKGLTK